LVKVYAASGTAKQQEKECFYNSKIPYLLRASPSNMIVGGDFNCVLNQTDSTGHFNYSTALNGLVCGFELQDMWHEDPLRTVFTHYSPMGASRIDRIYTTKELSDKKIGVVTVAAAFTDHPSVVMRLSVDVPIVQWGEGFWKMNTSIVSEETFIERLRQKWAVWRQQRRFYPDWPMWWGRYTKKQIRLFCIQVGSEHWRDFMKMENFLYKRIYDILQNTYPHGQKMTMLNHLKAKITSLH